MEVRGAVAEDEETEDDEEVDDGGWIAFDVEDEVVGVTW